MNKIITTILALMLISIGGVSAGNFACDYNGNGVVDVQDSVYMATINNWYNSGSLNMDLNDDSIVNIQDLVIFNSNKDNDGWCHSTFWDALNPTEDIVEEEQEQNGDNPYRLDLSEREYVLFEDTYGYNTRRFKLNNEDYYIDSQWSWFWSKLGWKAMENAKMTIRDSNFNNIKVIQISDSGSFELDGETINYKAKEWRNAGFKKFRFELER